MVAKGNPCPLLSVPGVTKATFRRDWLHGVDLGVGADALGNLFVAFRDKLPGANKRVRHDALWALINQWYGDNDIQDRLLSFKPETLKAAKKAPKLKGGAAMIRALIPFACETAHNLLDASDATESAMIQCATQLNECYKCLSKDTADWEVKLPEAAKLFANHFHALSLKYEGKGWKEKPKMHYFLEMCSDGTKPSMVWTYRDEDFGGAVARMARWRGSARNPAAQSRQVLSHWRNGQPVPRII